MQSRSGRSQKIRHSYMKIYGLTAALILVVALIVAITVTSLGVVSGKKPPVTTDPTSPSAPATEPEASSKPSSPSAPASKEEESSKEENVGKIQYIAVTEQDLTAINPLRIVDAEHPFNPVEAVGRTDCFPIADKSNPKNRVAFNTNPFFMNGEAFAALQQLQFVVGAAHEGYCLLLYNGHIVTLGADGTVSCKCSEGKLTDVSHSVHSTGYVVDLRYLKDQVGYQVYDSAVRGTVTATLLENCGRFGWIQSWSSANLALNGREEIDQRTFRYVGVPHALYIMEKGLTFDGYQQALKGTNYNKPLQIVDEANATVYNIYYVAAESALTKGVPVPQGASYTVQGNGADGFIVTITEKQGA
ncbi:MAG: hypothetical protein J6M12_08885 [Clostridia bacterium]|nr:hypothetical protein [Clostridia bacterium]